MYRSSDLFFRSFFNDHECKNFGIIMFKGSIFDHVWEFVLIKQTNQKLLCSATFLFPLLVE